MAYWVKKRVRIYDKSDNVPKRWKNLMRNEHVTTFRRYYPNMAQILVAEYNLSWNDTILVQWMTRLNLPHFKKYRTKPRKVFYGTVSQFRQHVWKFFNEKVWSRRAGE